MGTLHLKGGKKFPPPHFEDSRAVTARPSGRERGWNFRKRIDTKSEVKKLNGGFTAYVGIKFYITLGGLK
jgi:hypothetical protein